MSTPYDRTGARKGVLHHLGDGHGPAATADELRRRANPYRYEYPEYDFGILADGTVIPMRPLTVQGAHCIADRPAYNYADQWWNRNSIGIVLGIDAQAYPVPETMFKGLITFLVGLCRTRAMTMDDIYPHFQVTQTDCPGASYRKLGFNTGHLDYDQVEQSVNLLLKGADTMPVIFFFGPDDYILAKRVALKVNAAIAPRELYGKLPASSVFIVGGPAVDGAVNLTGQAWEDTAQAVINYLKG